MKDRFSIFTLVRFVFYLAFLLLLGLIYWSHLLQEEELQDIHNKIQMLTKELQHQVDQAERKPVAVQKNKEKKHENLLKEDLYPVKILPALLGKEFLPKGVLRMATIGKPDTLHPFSQWAEVAEWMNYCQATVAKNRFGYYEELSPDFALRIEERKSDRVDRENFWVHLRKDLLWQPLSQEHFPQDIILDKHFLKKHPVTAYDFKFYFDALSNRHVDVPTAVTLRFLLRDIESIQVIDDYTFCVTAIKNKKIDASGNIHYELPYATSFYVAQLKPLARFVYQYHPDGSKIANDDSSINFYKESAYWAQNFVNHFASRVIVSCGPWVFDGMTESGIRFRRNRDYYSKYAALFEAMEIYFLESPDSIFRDFIAQKIDICTVSPQDLVDLEQFRKSDVYAAYRKKGIDFNELNYLERSYSYVGWNQKNPLFSSKRIRQALTLAIDRNRLIRQNLRGQAEIVTGPFFIASDSYNKTIEPLAYDPDQAKRLLAEEGWFDSNADGTLEKIIDSKVTAFRFSLDYYVKNPVSKANCELIATFLKEVGIRCDLNGLDIADLAHRFEDKSFDAIYLAWNVSTPPDDPRQLWHSEGADEKGSSNMVGFRNSEVDRLVNELQYVHDKEKRQKIYWKLHEIIHGEMPYTFLYTPKNTLVWWNWIDNIFIPQERQDILPGADIEQPQTKYAFFNPPMLNETVE